MDSFFGILTPNWGYCVEGGDDQDRDKAQQEKPKPALRPLHPQFVLLVPKLDLRGLDFEQIVIQIIGGSINVHPSIDDASRGRNPQRSRP